MFRANKCHPTHLPFPNECAAQQLKFSCCCLLSFLHQDVNQYRAERALSDITPQPQPSWVHCCLLLLLICCCWSALAAAAAAGKLHLLVCVRPSCCNLIHKTRPRQVSAPAITAAAEAAGHQGCEVLSEQLGQVLQGFIVPCCVVPLLLWLQQAAGDTWAGGGYLERYCSSTYTREYLTISLDSLVSMIMPQVTQALLLKFRFYEALNVAGMSSLDMESMARIPRH